MFGMEKNKAKKHVFEFDLEKDVKSNPARKKNLSKEIEESIFEIKDLLRKGVDSEQEFEQYGILLRGYAGLQKVLSRISH